MINEALLKILVCPENKTPVSLAPDNLVAELNSKISAGQVKSRAGQVVRDNIQGGLIRADGKFLYPIRDEIPVMLIEEALVL